MTATAVAQARTDLYEALRAISPTPWRISRTAEPQPVAPWVFIDSPTLTVNNSIITASFPVVILVDGSVKAQIDALDNVVAHIWSAAMKVGVPSESRPVTLDVGGPNLRAQILVVDIEIMAITMCPFSLTDWDESDEADPTGYGLGPFGSGAYGR